ncbi:MAG: aldose 1-epimerase family protein [Bacteroidia bacterium]|nr:aldose 1-epimerase family protein [Bacteroidia bacterium]
MIYTISNQQIQISVKQAGAELCSIKNLTGTEFMWQAGAQWQRHAPVLFPIVGKLKDNGFNYNDKKYALTQHGFARDMLFNCVAKTDTITCTLIDDAFTQEKYPFKFKLDIIYSLLSDGVLVSYRITNTGSQLMPFSVGGHPAFNCPLLADEKFEDYEIVFDKSASLSSLMLQNGLFDGSVKHLASDSNRFSLHKHIFDDDALVFENLHAKHVKLLSKKTGSFVEMSLEGFPYLGIWSKPGAPFVCLEPWCGRADSVNANGNLFDKTGIEILAPGAQFERTYSIKVFSC